MVASIVFLSILLFLISRLVDGATNCSKEEFACTLGDQCILLLQWQDGIEDCVDASDEVCLPWQFDCKFGNPRCVAASKVKDGKIHCQSGADEGCPPHYFVCSDRSACIDPGKYQDGKHDCMDGSDEPCHPNEFSCRNGGCIPGELFQNGHKDCPDGSDEECTAHQFECACGLPRCIEAKRVHDGRKDCSDGSDESNGTRAITCSDGVPGRPSSVAPFSKGIDLCAKPNPCPEELGQVCILIGGAWRCVCKLGLVRPLGATRCIPPSLLPAYLVNPVANCTDYQNDLRLQIGSLKRSSFSIDVTPSKTNHFMDPIHQAASLIDNSAKTKEKELPKKGKDARMVIGTTKGENEVMKRTVENGLEDEEIDSVLPDDALYRILKKEGSCQPTGPPDQCPGNNTICILDLQGFYYCGCANGATQVGEECVVLIDECAKGNVDCDPNALCMDNTHGYECLCREGYLDVSDRPTLRPGRHCKRLVNECSNSTLNDCDPNARCIDKPNGFTCRCNFGYIDVSVEGARKPGKKCQRLVDECASKAHDCDRNAICSDLPQGYSCRCKDGFVDVDQSKPGRVCTQLSGDELREGSICIVLGKSTKCSCASGYLDLDKKNPGRKCEKTIETKTIQLSLIYPSRFGVPLASFQARGLANHNMPHYALWVLAIAVSAALGSNPCQDYSLHDCDSVAECVSEQPGYFQCHCPRGYFDASPDKRYPGRKCIRETYQRETRVSEHRDSRRISSYRDDSRRSFGVLTNSAVDECSLGTHNCDTHADCIDTNEGYTCRCRSGFQDSSPDPLRSPGRLCRPAQRSQCSHADCAPEAECRESPSGPICQCVSGYVDISRQHGRPQGRVCRAVVNECSTRQHDCSSHAACIDTAESFTCRCNEGFRDESPSILTRPGRVCVRAYTPEPPECEVADPMSCDQHKQEVCLFTNGTYKCRCASGYSRLPDGRCLVINECADKRLNDCGENAECIDQAEGYTCQCRSGYADVSPSGVTGRVCRARVNECANKQRYQVDCSENAICVDREDGYSCQCRPGFADVSAIYNRLPGRKCIEAINECLDPVLNDCSKNAVCEDAKEGFICTCRTGYVDASPTPKVYPGRVCMKPVERIQVKKMTQADKSFQMDGCDPKANSCASNEVCTDRVRKGKFTCECMDNAFRYSDGSCRLYSACSRQNDCDQNAVCLNVFDSYKCQCRPGFLDISPDPDNHPGKKCQELINECATADNECSIYAKCIDTTHSYTCQCQDGYIDVSSKFGFPPGRKCTNTMNECLDMKLNSCDENADCIDTPDGYTCQCFAGFVDVSSSANLPPGRVCTVQTTCPKQKTDLMFLIDGSGSIGSYVFKNEVLRFVKEFVDLFEIAADRTRVGLIQYSDQIRHEFDLNQHPDKVSLLRAIGETQYLTGLTRTGAAIQHMVKEGFSERRGARHQADDISRVAIIITDGRSQDNVSGPALAARDLKINIFAIGVTDHVLASELESIAGSPNRWFYVDRFKDLDTRLRSLIQKVACPTVQQTERRNIGPCNPRTQTGCDRALNELCIQDELTTRCVCPEGFERHPTTRICGGTLCNPQLTTSCIFPEECEITPFHNHRCRCPVGFKRDFHSGFCVSIKEVHIFPSMDADCHNGGAPCGKHEVCARHQKHYFCECETGYERNPHTGKCVYPGECNPLDQYTCDVRKREVCLNTNNRYSCQCARGEKRHAITGVCLKNECATGENDCDRSARCVDTDEGDGYFCACPNGFIDRSPDVVNKPGRLCGYICRCKTGYIDYSPNPHSFPGLVCKELVNECSSPSLNNCDRNAICIDTQEAYTCLCKAGFQDMDEFRNPGRVCKQIQQNDRCTAGKNNCDRNAICSQIGDDDFSCSCPPGFKDKSPNTVAQPGRVCIPVIPECDNPALNDCDSPDRAICTDTDEGFLCRCRQGFLDISPSIAVKPGRLCKQLQNECAMGLDDCARDGAICEDTPDSYTCRCAINYLDVSFDRQNRPGRKCKRLVDECATGQNDCSPEAICTDTEDSYVCACPATHIDVSPDTQNRPGRRCLLRINECTTSRHDCSPNADCIDTPESYSCRCRDDFVDESPDRTQRPGRICRPTLVDECRLGQHDCHSEAICHDLPQGFTCQCRPEFLDESPRRTTHPGRLCVPRPTPPPDECRIDSLRDCSQERGEICRLVNGIPKCSCPVDYSRDASGACTVIDECAFPQLNDCHPSAQCIDQPIGYTCHCKTNFKDIGPREKPGRLCKPMVNECEYSHLNDCHPNAQCIDLEEGYECKCHQGFMDKSVGRAGRICKQMINECDNPNQNSCDKNADCIDEEEGYRCECRENFYDVSPSPALKGRACRAILNECVDGKMNDCDRNARCTDTLDSYECECPPNSRDISPSPAFPGRVCLLFENECESGKHDCDAAALCHDNEQSFTCECPRGFVDRSPNKLTRPGRVCVRLVDECREARHTCSAQADCRDLEEGYTCECKDGYIDRSPNIQLQPGRVCGTPDVCPSNHECSSAAVCEPLGGNKYRCTCIQGYIDQSPPGQSGRICIRNNACRDPSLNNCSKNAICYDNLNGYRCECARGYIDKSPSPVEPGRICEAPPAPTPPPRHPCQDPELNDCHPAGTCRATGTKSYTCECLQGYADRSPDKLNKPGRLCVLTQPVCLDSSQNDCHPAAICSESSGPEKYTCRCRDGYIDESPNRNSKPGRICIEQVNECLDRSLNDCDEVAVCEDRPQGFTCRCPVGMQDRSPDPINRPGRKCFKTINECRSPSLNNCSRFADCFDSEDSFSCTCRDGYHDEDPTNPGIRCTYIINECESRNLNDCDRNAICIDTPGGYECRCKSPYRDEGPGDQPGRVCRLNECLEAGLNNCGMNADCRDTDDGYYCACRTGFYDNSPNPREPGRICIAFENDNVSKQPNVQFLDVVTTKITGTLCGRYECNSERGEVCIGGVECGCRPGESRSDLREQCQKIQTIPFQIRIVARNDQALMYSSEYGNDESPTYIEIVDTFKKDIARSFGGTSFAPRFVNTDVDYITHPRTVNSSWPDGLLFKFNVQTTVSEEPVDACELWKQMQGSLQRTNGAIGGGSLRVAADTELLNPCRVDEIEIFNCGKEKCKEELGEVCIAGHVCGCSPGMKRANKESPCRVVESWSVPILVARQATRNLVFDSRVHSNPLSPVHKELVQRFEKGIADCYPHTEVRSAFVTAEVNDIVEPATVNATWDSGLLFNATMHFRRGAVREPSDVYYSLIRYINEKNGGEIGDSELYLTPYQPDPFKACYKNDCHSSGKCIDLAANSYRCECGPGFRDLEPNNPGHKCLPTTGFNECEKKETNECSVNARCIDLPHLYKCECLPSYADASPPGAIPGSVCHLDYCSDVTFCPTNSTCKNLELQAECRCEPGYMDIRKSEKRADIGLEESYCMHTRDVNECALGLTNCSGVAECIDRPIGYTCKCPDGYIDGNPDEPGRVCGALLCDLCNSHGDCVHNAQTNNITCVCTDGWKGEFCETAPSNASLVLLIILALLFLLLALCCLLYMCTRCHCFKGRGGAMGAFGYRNSAWPWATLDGSSSSESGEHSHSSIHAQEYYPDIGIPRAKLAKGEAYSSSANKSTEVARLDEYLDTGAMHIPRARLAGGGGLNESFDSSSSAGSDYTIKEEIERRVTTDVNIKEIKTTTTTDADGNTVTTTAEYHHYPEDGSTHLTNTTAGARSSYGAESSSHYAAAHESASSSALHSAHSESASAMASSASRSAFAAGGSASRSAYANHATRLSDEQERGESIAEFSIGRVEGRRSAAANNHLYSENREISEYTDEASMYSSEEEEFEHEKGDKRTRVQRQHSFEPLPGGDRERFRTEVVTTKTSTSTTKH
ncbi:unnamed protein product, partial [Mesorhabditis belari]|uniref:Transmembrane cell adhesion receptor mua-3 n=1 Tax=Mesorhabditis belari TaxID=2138241 RepID=A0AAF3EBA3_9BILA